METKKGNTQPWLNSMVSDSIFILAPPFLALLLVWTFPEQFKVTNQMPLEYWMILVVFVDVAHVYATLYRTYFNPLGMKTNQALLTIIPICCYLAGVLLYAFNGLWFWRILAYLAVFHFIRQQYGFMRLYARNEIHNRFNNLVDTLAIYTASLYPMLYWHFGSVRNFNWFVDGDFFHLPSQSLVLISTYFYVGVLVLYLIKEIYWILKTHHFNIPRNLLIAGTFLSWYFGIVYFNGDMAFTTLNVISHGIPYMALIWFFERHKSKTGKVPNTLMKLTFSKYGLVLFILIIISLAYLEEGLWDGLVWRDHPQLFTLFGHLPEVSNQNLLTLIVPLLALPQSTHYVLDGFIWKRKQNI